MRVDDAQLDGVKNPAKTAVLGTTAISLASAWAYGEVKGWEHSLHKKLWEAPGFYATYMACVGAAAAIVLIPHVPLQLVIISVQVFAGLVLPSAIIFLQLLLNDRELLGDHWVNRPWNNVVNWTIIWKSFVSSIHSTISQSRSVRAMVLDRLQ